MSTWDEFTDKLERCLGAFPEGILVLSDAQRDDYFVQFADLDGDAIKVEATSNRSRPDEPRLTDDQCADLEDDGWLADPDTTNYARPCRRSGVGAESPRSVAQACVRALQVMGVAGPAHLVHQAWLVESQVDWNPGLGVLPKA